MHTAMSTIKRAVAPLAFVAFVGLAASACGTDAIASDPTNTPTTTTGTSTPPPTSTTPPATSTPTTTPPTATPTAIPTFTPTPEATDYSELQEKLNEAQSKWFASGAQTYSYKFGWMCYCITDYTAPVRINVVGDGISTVEYVPGDNAPTGTPDPEEYRTIRQLFEFIQDAINEGAHSINAEFDPELGYPTNVFIDYEEMMADEEKGFEVSELEIPGRDYGALQTELDAAKAKWAAAAAEGYEFTFNWSCFCPPELNNQVRIVVSGGEIVSATYVDDGSPVTEPYLKEFHTIDGLFDFIQTAIDNEDDSIIVEYDEELGYPKAANIDRIAMAIDDEQAFQVADLTVDSEG